MIPDYLIYDELKRRKQEQERENRAHLELPLYRPLPPIREREEETRDDEDRGVFIIDMNDWVDELEGDATSPDAPGFGPEEAHDETPEDSAESA